MELPFYYIVRFNLIGYNSPGELKIDRHEISFSEAEPILNRNNAFNEFEEYQNFIKDRVINENGVSYINRNFLLGDNNGAYRNFEQSIEIILKVVKSVDGLFIVSDNDSSQNELVIHKISSPSIDFEPQCIMDNLLEEIRFYDHFKLDKGNKEKIVRYFGLDYYDTGEDPDVLDNRILVTPFNWEAAKFIIEPELKTPSDLISEVLKNGEGFNVEFKPSLLYNFKSEKAGYAPMYHAAKSIASFLNSGGGILVIGVINNGEIQGLKYDYSLYPVNPKDKFRNAYAGLFSQFLKPSLQPFIETRFYEFNQEEIFVVFVNKCNRPVFLRSKSEGNEGKEQKEFFIRIEESSRRLTDIEEIIEYIFNNWNVDK